MRLFILSLILFLSSSFVFGQATQPAWYIHGLFDLPDRLEDAVVDLEEAEEYLYEMMVEGVYEENIPLRKGLDKFYISVESIAEDMDEAHSGMEEAWQEEGNSEKKKMMGSALSGVEKLVESMWEIDDAAEGIMEIVDLKKRLKLVSKLKKKLQKINARLNSTLGQWEEVVDF